MNTLQGGSMPDLPDAHVIETGQGAFKVRPGAVAVKHDDGFDIKNLAGSPVWIQLPVDIIVADDTRAEREALLEKVFDRDVAVLLAKARWVNHGDTAHFDFRDGVTGVFEYHVVVFPQGGGVPADGDSPPRIIVDP
jgi:hypothetical protein